MGNNACPSATTTDVKPLHSRPRLTLPRSDAHCGSNGITILVPTSRSSCSKTTCASHVSIAFGASTEVGRRLDGEAEEARTQRHGRLAARFGGKGQKREGGVCSKDEVELGDSSPVRGNVSRQQRICHQPEKGNGERSRPLGNKRRPTLGAVVSFWERRWQKVFRRNTQ